MKKALPVTILCSLLFIISCGNKDSGDISEAGDAQPIANSVAADVTYIVAPGTSVVMWEGYKPGRTHTGTIDVSTGKLLVNNGIISGGLFAMDMKSITSTDLEPGKGKEDLEAHLKGTDPGKENDFFNVTQFPSGTFAISKVVTLENDPSANHMIYGNLTLKGISKSIAFRANVEHSDNTLVVTSPLFKIDRTEWGLKFMSRNFFDNLGDKFINDEFGLSINLVAVVEAK